ncbi:ash family protein [Vibrio parahaemolyticus]|nr:ash family protein [Vibrio parahaemolyticus]
MLNSLSVCLSSIAKYTPFDDNSRAVAKSTVGIGLLSYTKAHNASLLMLVFYCVRFSTSKYYGGLGEGTKVHRFLCSGKTNLVQFTTHKIGLFSGGFCIHTKEASVMLTTPTQFAPMTITGGATC